MSLDAPKGYYPTYEITENDDGIRPAGQPDECFYCNRKVGQLHEDGCVITWKDKTVKLVAVIEIEKSVPEHYNREDIMYKYNEGTWCASNLQDEFDKDCGCDRTEVIFPEQYQKVEL
jgi:hypothetical protein